jgi:predicted dehydrogenase
MAQQYAKVLQALDYNYQVIGRGEASANRFQQTVGRPVFRGGLAEALKARGAPEAAIVAITVENLSEVARELIAHGVRRILLEKPGGVTESQIARLVTCVDDHGAQCWIGYNRRFLSSTIAARKTIERDGGVSSFTFDFTERTRDVALSPASRLTKNKWVIANSSHVVDLAFHLGGWPAEIKTWATGKLDWHPSGSCFAGAGVTENGALFSYQSDWSSPGGWGIEVSTGKHRLQLRPLETLWQKNHGESGWRRIGTESETDINLKPGLREQTFAFLSGNTDYMCSILDQLKMLRILNQIAAYQSVD